MRKERVDRTPRGTRPPHPSTVDWEVPENPVIGFGRYHKAIEEQNAGKEDRAGRQGERERGRRNQRKERDNVAAANKCSK